MIVKQLFEIEKLTPSEKEIVHFIEQNPRIVINLSLKELSEKCYVSEASVIRLCKKIGVAGFAEFKIKLASELTSFALVDKDIHIDIPIAKDSTSKEIATTFFNLAHRTLETTYNNIDFTEIEKAAALLAKADLIHIYGRGESLILAEDFHYKLLRIGYNSTLETLNGFQEAKCIRSESKISRVALLISHYCHSKQVHYIVDELMSNKIPFILLTAQKKAWPYDSLASVTLRISNSESLYKMGSFASRNAMLFTLDCLYGQLFSMNYDQNFKNLTDFSKRKLERSYYYQSQHSDD